MNKIVLISGCSSDLGITLANMFLDMNYKVIGLYNNNNIENNRIESFKCDITKEEEIDNLFKYIKEKYGYINVLINIASISKDNDIYEKSKKEFMDVLEVNLVGTFLMCKYASLLLNDGVIVSISSTNGIDTYTPLSIDYDASKAGIINMTKNLALRLPNIKICAIAPNWIDTKSTLEMDSNYLESELKRIKQTKLIKKEDVCKKIIDIINDNSIRSGSIIRMDDGCE